MRTQNQAHSPIYIETNGYLLRSLTVSDITPRFLKWINSPDLSEGLNLPSLNFDEPKLSQFISGFDNHNNYLIGIFDKTDNLLIGFYTLDINRTHKVGNITCAVGESEYEGKGVLWATINALLDYYFNYNDIYKIVARVLASNRRMLYNFIGNDRFFFEAKLEKECLLRSGKRAHVMLFAAFQDRNPIPSPTKGITGVGKA